MNEWHGAVSIRGSLLYVSVIPVFAPLPPSFHQHLITRAQAARFEREGAVSIAMATASLLTPLHPSLQFPWRPCSLQLRAQLPTLRRHILSEARHNDPINKRVSAQERLEADDIVCLCVDLHLNVYKAAFLSVSFKERICTVFCVLLF